MSQLPNGESVEKIEGIEQADVVERLGKDPEEQRNREAMSDPANQENGADGT